MDQKLAEIHPGEILWEEFMLPRGVTAVQVASAIDVSPEEIEGILHCTHPISVDVALNLARYFDIDAQFWINLQTEYDARMMRA